MGNKKSLITEFIKETTSNVIATIIGGVILSTGLIAIFWSSISSNISLLYNTVTEPLILPKFAPYLSYIIGVISIYVFLKFSKKITQGNQKELESYKDYRKDKYMGFIWTWDYISDSKEVDKDKITVICPECNSRMNVSDNSGSHPNYRESLKTTIKCTNLSCNYSDVEFDFMQELPIMKSKLYNDFCNEVDRNLREMGLKL